MSSSTMNNTTTNESYTSDQYCELVDRIFESEEEACDSLLAWGSERGIAFIIADSKPMKTPSDKGKKEYIRYVCSRSGAYRAKRTSPTHPDKIRDKTGAHSTTKIGCPVKIAVTFSKREDCYYIRYPNDEQVLHNHPPSRTLPAMTKYAVKQWKDEIIRLAQAGSTASKIYNTLRDKAIPAGMPVHCLPGNLTIGSIYNVINNFCDLQIANKAPIDWLFDHIQQNSDSLFFRHDVSADGKITRLFLAYKGLINIMKAFHKMLFLDCTYKTNRYRLPLLNFVGYTNMDNAFNPAVCFLSQDCTKDDYVWALESYRAYLEENSVPLPTRVYTDREKALMNAVEEVLPDSAHALCLWQIRKNVEANCRKHFKGNVKDKEALFGKFMASFNAIIKSPSPASFHEIVKAFTENDEYPQLARDYVNNSWVNPYAQQFVLCFVIETGPTYDVYTTPTVSGMYRKIKDHLHSSSGDLVYVFEALKQIWVTQSTRLTSENETASNRVMVGVNAALFREVSGSISKKVLNRILAAMPSYEALDGLTRAHYMSLRSCPTCVDPVCTREKALGVPCRHRLFFYMAKKLPLPLSEIDEFWYLRQIIDSSFVETSNVPGDIVVPTGPLTKQDYIKLVCEVLSKGLMENETLTDALVKNETMETIHRSVDNLLPVLKRNLQRNRG